MSRFSREIDEEHPLSAASRTSGGVAANAELALLIDQSAGGTPTFSEFLRRLESRGVTPLPSVNARGLNGMSYRFRGETVRGSDIGRAYTAQGLRDRKGVLYSPERDLQSIRDAADTSLRIEGRGARTRDTRTGLSLDQIATLTEIGRFRTVSVGDLIEHRYGGQSGKFAQDIRVLREAGLADRRTATHAKSGPEYEVVVLTAKGRRAAMRAAKTTGSSQEFYAGLVKSAEIRHDIGTYRMYQSERAQIEAAGGRVTKVAMDFEIKRRLMSDLNRRGEDPRDLTRKLDIAAHHEIRIVNGRFVIPDLRVEYETRDGAREQVDLELATKDYKPTQMAAKRAAGLKIYGPDSFSGGTPREPERGTLVSI